MTNNSFSTVDYVVFSVSLVFSAFVGFYYAFKERHKNTTMNFLLGDRKLQMIPVGLSILASFTSAVSILGFSQEMYRFGSMYMLIGLSYCITVPFAGHVYAPFFHKLKITSAYEYLEMRFNRAVRILASLIFTLQMLFYMAIALYTPSLAINQVMGIPLWLSIVVTGLVCTLYTSLGGIKAVIWTDTFQVIVMFAGLIAVIIEGVIRVGGVKTIWDRAYQSGRIEFFNFDPNPFQRHSFWSIMIGGFFTSLTVFGSNQATIQRYISLPTKETATKAMYINLIGMFSILVVSFACGFIAFAFYFDCDPKLSGEIKKYDQILPYLVMDLLGHLPGLPGLFIACLYSAALSTVSSGLNSLSAVSMSDFLQPIYQKLKIQRIRDSVLATVSKIIAALFGVITVFLAYACDYLGSTVLQISLSIFGLLGGPLLGVFSLGMFVPYANGIGALFGLIISLSISMWLGIGSVLYGKLPESKPFNLNCTNTNSSFFNTTNLALNTLNSTNLANQKFSIYQLSYLWFSATAILNVFIFGLIVTFITKMLKLDDSSGYTNENLYIRICRRKRGNQKQYNLVHTNYMTKHNNEIIDE